MPDILPEAPEFQALPPVLTTGALLALMEWACIEHITPELADGQITLGVGMNLTHDAPCTTGAELRISCEVQNSTERKLTWQVEVRAADDTLLGTGVHTRAVVARSSFVQAVNSQVDRIGGDTISG
ncbi:thioesterase family protein [Corynebacterium ciconiae]|uniref:thioesterase family protein n=1 Tax=Corynebacterium ciconiae TaxID=227319 RepID=UPI0012EAB16B|nr:hotdog domain-containing protein [Corynebacterium ciconiae]